MNQGIFCHVNLETNTGKFVFLQCKLINFQMQYKPVLCSGQFLMCSMKCTCSGSGHLQVQVQCVMYTVHCALCTMQCDEELEVVTG